MTFRPRHTHTATASTHSTAAGHHRHVVIPNGTEHTHGSTHSRSSHRDASFESTTSASTTITAVTASPYPIDGHGANPDTHVATASSTHSDTACQVRRIRRSRRSRHASRSRSDNRPPAAPAIRSALSSRSVWASSRTHGNQSW